MRPKLVLTTAFVAAGLAGAALAQTAPPAPAVSPPGPSYPEFSGGADKNWTPNYTLGPLDAARDPKPVYAVIAGHVVSGEIQPRSRLLTLVDQGEPQFLCDVSHRGPEVRLDCSDGTRAEVKPSASGCGRSRSGEAASLCIGLKAKYAAQRLAAPEGYVLVADAERLELKRPGS
jgi:hypothetical protein